MARTRTSVELYPDGCRLVEVEAFARRRTPDVKDARVRTFALSVAGAGDPVALAENLGRLRKEQRLSRDASAIIWGLRAVHQLLRLPPAKPDALEAIAHREARKEIVALEAAAGRASVAIEPGAEIEVGAHRRREVALVAAAVSELQERIQPLIDAGFTVQRVLTPAMALTALARTQRDSRGTVVYVAITGGATCFAVVRNRMLMFARELPWGYEAPPEARGQKPEEFSIRLASELKRSVLYFKQTFRAPIEGITLCGDMPNLRALTAPLGESLGLPVQVLDSLVGIDAATVPQPAEQFRREVAGLRMAIAAGAVDAADVANLLPKSILETRAARRQIVRWTVSAAAGLLLTAGWYGVARSTAASQRSEKEAIQRELSIAEPGAARQAELQQAYVVTTSRAAALAAFDSQGPRLARLLEAVAASTPDEVVLTQVAAHADGAHWRVDLRGAAISSDAAVAQGAVSTFVQRLSESPFGGAPVQPPSRRLVSARAAAPAAGARPVAIPAGMTGVEFAMQIRVAK